MSDLKRCPFCGGEAKIQSNLLHNYRIYCVECGCQTISWSESKEKAIEAWNRRAGESEDSNE